MNMPDKENGKNECDLCPGQPKEHKIKGIEWKDQSKVFKNFL